MGDSSTAVKSAKANEWTTVTSIRRQKKSDTSKTPSRNSSAAANEKDTTNSDGKSIFSSLDEVSEARKNRLLASKQASESKADADKTSSESEDEFDNEGDPKKENGVSEEIQKKVKKPKQPKVSISSAAAAIDPLDFSTYAAQITQSYENLPELQLMRLADYFAKSFSGVSGEYLQLQKSFKDADFSRFVDKLFLNVPEPLVAVVGDSLAKFPAQELSKFVILLLKEVLDDVAVSGGKPKAAPTAANPKSKAGLYVVISILLRKRPDALLLQAESLRSAEYSKQEKLIVICWAYAQVVQADLPSGMWLWVRNLLPLIVGKQSTPLTRDIGLTFYESIICKNLKKARSALINSASKKGERLVPPPALESLLRAAYPPSSARTKVTDRILAIYPLVKEVALAGSLSSNKSTKPFAEQLLPLALAAAGEDDPFLSEEGSSLFVWALAQNAECFKQWEKYHSEHLFSSTRVLTYLLREWKTVKGSIAPTETFRKTLSSFRKKHIDLLKKGDSDLEKNVKKADAACRSLLSKTSSLPGCMAASLTLLVAVAMGYGFYELSPRRNPWGWDGLILLSKTHPIF